MSRFALIAKRFREEASTAARAIHEWLRARGHEVLLDDGTAEDLGQKGSFSRETVPDDVDMAIVVGGDGTFLSVVRAIGHRPIPILGVNAGYLGFLTEVTLDEVNDTLERVCAGEIECERRMMLDATILRDGMPAERYTVLNDAVINRGALARVIGLHISVGDRFVADYRADGLIISTPTGSTGYCLAAGGPIVHPTLDSVVLVPICPLTLANRPILLPDTLTVRIDLQKQQDVDAALTLDGQVGVQLHGGETILVEKAKYRVTLVKSPHRDYYRLLRTKLKWTG